MENDGSLIYTKEGYKTLYRWTFFLILLGTLLLSILYILNQRVRENEKNPAPTQALNPLQKTVQLATIELIELSLAYSISTDAQKRIILPKITDLAQKRKSSMLTLMNIYPDIALRITYPNHSRGLLPPQVDNLIEKETTVKGTFEILHSDTLVPDVIEIATPSAEPIDRYFLSISDDKQLSLVFVDEDEALRNLSPQTQVELRGIQLDDVFVANISENSAVQASNSIKGIVQRKVLAASTKNLAVILVHPRDAPNFPDKTIIENTLFNNQKSLNTLFRESSQDSFSWTGQVFGPYESTEDSSTCNNRTQWLKDADDGLRRDGINLSGYTKLYMWEPYKTDCPFGGGYALPGGSAYINGAWSFGEDWVIKIVAHELGHTFGFAHARWQNSSCNSQTEYGDCFDPMGIGLHDFHGLHKSQLGWITTRDITTSGTYTLQSLSSPNTGVKNLRIKKDNKSAYYIEYRNNTGIFEQFGQDPVTKGVSIRLGSLIYDTPVFQYTDVIKAGATSFSDSTIGLLMSVKNQTQDALDIEVTLPANPLCIRANPTATLSPSGQFGTASDVLSYTLTVTNNDSTPCPDTQFSLTSTLEAQFVQNPASTTLMLSPSETKTIALQIISSPTLQPGFYTFTEIITNALDSSYKTTLSANYNVEPSNPPSITPSQEITPTEVTTQILSPTMALSQTPIKADFNQDGRVDIFDYNVVTSTFGNNLDLRADFNNSGSVDIFDYNTLIENLGT